MRNVKKKTTENAQKVKRKSNVASDMNSLEIKSVERKTRTKQI